MGAFPHLGQHAAAWELAMLGGRTKSSREVNKGIKEQTLPVAWWGRLQGQKTSELEDTRT